ncbi:hypothetical protein BDA99DRAFT_538079 [Phascolomyces articulosus]|uniref:Uncharacterized protein n=1 Tax=Phascolomyces articulosus TaxID=60185 RepID=A0AAD5K8Y6_9FUNG|nr:hypothetical protein BDA99DRAFT_538079 [Phascolomyces articulosus]
MYFYAHFMMAKFLTWDINHSLVAYNFRASKTHSDKKKDHGAKIIIVKNKNLRIKVKIAKWKSNKAFADARLKCIPLVPGRSTRKDGFSNQQSAISLWIRRRGVACITHCSSTLRIIVTRHIYFMVLRRDLEDAFGSRVRFVTFACAVPLPFMWRQWILDLTLVANILNGIGLFVLTRGHYLHRELCQAKKITLRRL